MKSLKNLPFLEDIEGEHGEAFLVGGAVRDDFLNKSCKDFDLLITKVPQDVLLEILKQHGKVNEVGKSFAIIKFKAFDSPEDEEPFDIAIPRTEVKNGTSHTDFIVTSNPWLPIEKDLERRDFTINAIARDIITNNIVDPFNGIQDLLDKKIRVLNDQSFNDDPLRMLRAVQFAARFNFEIEEETFKQIQKNAHLIKDVSKERVLEEFQKIIKKGNPKLGVSLLVETGLFFELFGFHFRGRLESFDQITNLAEFFFCLCQNHTDQIHQIFKNTFRGDINNTKEIKALEMLKTAIHDKGLMQSRKIIFNALQIWPKVVDTKIFVPLLGRLSGFRFGDFPTSFKELAVNGDDFIELGIQGEKLGKVRDEVLNTILEKQIDFQDKQTLIDIIKSKI